MIYNSDHILRKINEKLSDKEQIKSEDSLLHLLKSRTDNNEEDSRIHISAENLLIAFSDFRLKLAEHMKLDGILFLFGNGVSMYAGSQDTRAFKLADYKDEFSDLSSIIEEAGHLCGIEEQLNALYITSAYYHLIKDEKKEKNIINLIDKIKEKLINDFVNSVDYSKLFIHEMFLLKLRAFDCLKRTSIYTPNYDLAFEYSLDKLGIEYKDGFSGFVNRIFDPRTLQSKDKTALIKVHGSINWVFTEGIIKEYQPRFKDGKVIIDDTKPVLIYPSSYKMYQTYSAPYSELMRYMLNETETGKNVIVVLGYKYGDDHLNEILIKALENPHNIVYFFVYNPDERNNFLDQVKRLADSMSNINIMTGKILADFEIFVKYMLPATAEKTDQEKAIELLQKVLVNYAD